MTTKKQNSGLCQLTAGLLFGIIAGCFFGLMINEVESFWKFIFSVINAAFIFTSGMFFIYGFKNFAKWISDYCEDF